VTSARRQAQRLATPAITPGCNECVRDPEAACGPASTLVPAAIIEKIAIPIVPPISWPVGGCQWPRTCPQNLSPDAGRQLATKVRVERTGPDLQAFQEAL
jgi:hypothetical protein